MGCCGGSPSTKATKTAPRRYLVGTDGLVLVRYTGDEFWQWFTGSVTQTKYPFGTKRRLGLVDVHDAGNGPECVGKLLGERENGEPCFEAVG